MLSGDRAFDLLESVPGVVWETRFETDGRQAMLYVNSAVESLFGYTVDEWMHTPDFWARVIHPEDSERVAEEIRRAVDSCRDAVSRLRIVAREGRVVWCESHYMIVCDERLRPVGLRGVTLDISERIRAEQQYLEQKERLDGIIQSAMDAVITIDESHRIVVFNRAAEQMFRVAADQAIGLPLETFLPEKYVRAHRGHIAEFDRTGVTSRSMTRPGAIEARRMDGSVFPIEATISKVETPGGKLFTAILRDQTEKVRRETRQAYLAKASRIVASSLDYQTTLSNLAEITVPDFADWFAVDLLTADGNSLELVCVSHRDREKVELARELRRRYPVDLKSPMYRTNVVNTGETEFFPEIGDDVLTAAITDPELLLITRSLGLRSSIAVPMRSRGRIIGAITFIQGESNRYYDNLDRDTAEELTGRAAVAIDNARLYRDAQQAIRNRQDILSIVSHDLRNPLHAIEISAVLLKRLAGDDRLEKPVDRISRAARRAMALIEDLNLVAKIEEGGGFRLAREAVSLNALLEEVQDGFQLLAQDKGLTLSVERIEQDATLSVDHKRLYQALANVISNALKFSPAGSVVEVGARRDGDAIAFRVHDEGPGIPAEHFANIFQKNWQGENAKDFGSGLGLYIAKAILEAHGGAVSVESAEGEGTTFFLSLPVS